MRGADEKDRTADHTRVWSVAEAKAHLSTILRLAESDGPQVIGLRRPCVVLPMKVWLAQSSDRKPLGQWLVQNASRGTPIPTPDRQEPSRGIPFVDH